MKLSIKYFFSLFFLLTAIVSCKEDEPIEIVKESGTLTDIEGNVYNTIKIGNQWWMAENLKVKKFRNGTNLTSIQTSSDWSAMESAAYCAFDNNNQNIATYGLLYNWFAVADINQIAPEGWHVPTDDDWKELENYLGMSVSETDNFGWRGTNAGDQLKVEAPKGWTVYGSVWGDNSSGFTALAGACRLFDGRWAEPGLFATGFWWTGTEYSSSEAYYRYLDKKNSGIYRSHTYINYGFSIRCVKNK